eukprot:5690033-Lingulodinium_polyedra.AAC.1
MGPTGACAGLHGGGSIAGSTTGSKLTPVVESTLGLFALDAATGSYEEFEFAPGSPQWPLLVSTMGYIGVRNSQWPLLVSTT